MFENIYAMIRFLYIDLFCGAGGTSIGVEAARLHGEQVAKVIACVNHDANAIASHAANHPDALHFVEDIRTLNLDRCWPMSRAMREQYPAARVVLWASLRSAPTSQSLRAAKAGDADSRTLAGAPFSDTSTHCGPTTSKSRTSRSS